MLFAQFYAKSAVSVYSPEPKLVKACGDRAVIILDARKRLDDNMQIAAQVCKERGYMGLTLHKGDTFTRSKRVRDFLPIHPDAVFMSYP